MTLVVSQRQPTENGLPIEIYVFTKERRLKSYEEVQSEIFDHILAILPEFGLHVFQNPTGEDLNHSGINIVLKYENAGTIASA